MSDDLVERLRGSVRACRALDRSALLAEAADEIERLRSWVRIQDAVIRSGNVAALTEEERVVLGNVANDAAYRAMSHTERVVRGLLERLK